MNACCRAVVAMAVFVLKVSPTAARTVCVAFVFQVRTLFVSGLPMDAKPRELYLLFRAYKVRSPLIRTDRIIEDESAWRGGWEGGVVERESQGLNLERNNLYNHANDLNIDCTM